MKRPLGLLLILLMVLSLASCALPAIQNETGFDLPIHTLEETRTEAETPASSAYVPESTAAETATEQAESDSRQDTETPSTAETESPADPALLDESGWYNTKEEVALFIHQYGRLPDNYISKKAAEALGWPGGSLEPYAPGKSIGGSRFGNYEGLLPDARNRTWTECDIDTAGKRSRGAKRIVFSNDGLIYYTDDHYETFELLYGTP